MLIQLVWGKGILYYIIDGEGIPSEENLAADPTPVAMETPNIDGESGQAEERTYIFY